MGTNKEEFDKIERLLNDGVINQDEYNALFERLKKSSFVLNHDEGETLKGLFRDGIITQEQYNHLSEKIQDESAGVVINNNKSEKQRVIKWVLLGSLILVLIVAIAYRTQINQRLLDPSEIYGNWVTGTDYIDDYMSFKDDNTVRFSFTNQLQAKWEIEDEQKNIICLHYDMTDEQLAKFNEDHYQDFGDEELTKEETIELLREQYSDRLPPEGQYRFVRTENHLVPSEGDVVISPIYNY